MGCRAGITAQSAQATVRRLEERGAVERRTEGGRGRTAELHITERPLSPWTGTMSRSRGLAADQRLAAALRDPGRHRGHSLPERPHPRPAPIPLRRPRQNARPARPDRTGPGIEARSRRRRVCRGVDCA
ncbi:hypothetical protein [Streptomyces malaysiensis]|uniref:hypothetical protein n=1 Tax=Streptomyces malaysiensis TaxID=92644 RepID=UPI00352BBA04